MSQYPEYDVDTRVQYVNDRQGQRPPSIKCGGVYYTIADAAIGACQQHQNRDVTLRYYTNNSGYNVAVAINGQPLPRDQGRGGGGGPRPAGGQQGQQGQPRPAGSQAGSAGSQAGSTSARGVVKAARIQAYAGVARSCIEMGLDEDQYRGWIECIGRALAGEPPASGHTAQPGGYEDPGPGYDEQAQQEREPAPDQGQTQADFDDDIPF